MLSYSHGVTSRNATLACLLRQTQWKLDDVAHDLPAGRCSEADRARLANLLVHLAQVIRDHDQTAIADGDTEPTSTPHPPA